MAVISIIILFIIPVAAFCREVRLDRKKFAQKRQADNEHILREVARFLREREI